MKSYKIIVAVHPNDAIREEMVRLIAVKLGFARTPSDAGKLICTEVHSIDISRAYFVLASRFSFRESPGTAQRLFQLAARGLAVVVGVKRLPREYEQFCEAYYDITELKR